MKHEGHEGHEGRCAVETRVTALDVSHEVIAAAMKVHTALGPGMLESVYEVCLAYELRKLGHKCETQLILPIQYDGVRLDAVTASTFSWTIS